MNIEIYKAQDFSLTDFEAARTILDVGCGDGFFLRQLADKGYKAFGIEPTHELVARLREEGYNVQVAQAEALPFPAGAFDGIHCSVVLPYTDERVAISEWNRVLAPGGEILASYHGIGYGFLCLFKGDDWKTRFYGARMLLNTWVYRLTGRRIPGWLGDTICQSESRLDSYYADHNFRLLKRFVSKDRVLGQSVFIYDHLRKSA